ncbi:hypothetical protein F4804DRAFT_309461 [Jackrogersella minutella]|nr:hypothetical protein F4804DRAFT_309461 [Jackrogersella minutella]
MHLGPSHRSVVATRNLMTCRPDFLTPRGFPCVERRCRSLSSHSVNAIEDSPRQICRRAFSTSPGWSKAIPIRQVPSLKEPRVPTVLSLTQNRARSPPQPSASVVLISPENQVLMVQRVSTTSVFSTAHVFPGGHLSTFHDGCSYHDGTFPAPSDVRVHEDSLPYRLCAIRETFEECGILLAREQGPDGKLLNLSEAERDKARKPTYRNETAFPEWLRSVGGFADTENLLPFTRWITPPRKNRRYTTQMYIYMLPLSARNDPSISATSDDGCEIKSVHFDYARTWLEKQRTGEVLLLPPQCYLLHLVSQFLDGPPPGSPGPAELMEHYRSQREKLRKFIDTTPTATEEKARRHYTARIPWAEKAICTFRLGVSADNRSILVLDDPGPELEDTKRGGDRERVILLSSETKELEVRSREEVLAERRQLCDSQKNEIISKDSYSMLLPGQENMKKEA